MSDDIVYRLRNPNHWLFQIVGPKSGATVQGESDAPREAADEIERLRAELAAAQEKTSVSLTVGGGLEVYGTMDAIHRVKQYILLDSRHPVESADVRRSLARALQAAEAERDTLRATISSELDDAIQSQSWDKVIAVRDHLDAALKGDGKV